MDLSSKFAGKLPSNYIHRYYLEIFLEILIDLNLYL